MTTVIQGVGMMSSMHCMHIVQQGDTNTCWLAYVSTQCAGGCGATSQLDWVLDIIVFVGSLRLQHTGSVFDTHDARRGPYHSTFAVRLQVQSIVCWLSLGCLSRFIVNDLTPTFVYRA